MPRFYFDVHNAAGYCRDEFGDEFVNFEEARSMAQLLLPDIARGGPLANESCQISCDVRDETDRIVYRGEVFFRGVKYPG
ncbi:MAG: DUF6894 family protein [Janthinobacterium lividum]